MLKQDKDLDSQVRELEIRNNSLDQEIEAMLKELNVTPEQLSAYIKNPENFTDNNWKEMQKLKLRLDQKLERDLDHVRNPKKADKAFRDLHVDQNWLFVK